MPQRNRSTPPTTVVPILVYPDVREAVSWLSRAFGFVERTRIGEGHRAQMSIGGDGAVIVAAAGGEQQPPIDGVVSALVRVRVDDVEARFEQARAHGAGVVERPTEREYGERDCTVEDLAGHRWQFAETRRDVAPEEFGCETVAPWPGATNLTPFLLFDGNCAEAMTFYRSCLGGELTVTRVGDTPMGEHAPPGQQHKVAYASLRSGSAELSATDWLHPTRMPKPGNTVAVYVQTEDDGELRAVFEKLAVGADEDLLDSLRDMPFGTYGHLADRYGVHWFFRRD